MKFYSETLNSYFNTEKECLDAEKKYSDALEEQEKLQKAKEISTQKAKKEAAKKVEDAEAVLSEAYDNFKVRKQEADEYLAKAKANYSHMLEDAAKIVREEELNRLNAIKDFNDKFGVYSKVYTGEKASREVARISDFLSDWFSSSFLKNFWW